MPLSFFAYVDESEDNRFPTSTIIGVTECIPKGVKRVFSEAFGKVSIIGLDAIAYEDEEDLKQQVNVILTELKI